MRKRITSLFLVLALCLTLLPTTALAEEAGAAQETQDSTEVGDGYTIEEDTAVQGKGENDKAVQTVQALIDALPAAEDISDANADEVSGQLDAIDEAKQALTEEQAARLDLTGYDAAAAAVLALAGEPDASEPALLAAIAGTQPGGSGTAEDPYRITGAAELIWLRDAVNAGAASTCAELRQDVEYVDEVWTSIGTSEHPYTGTFNGNGHTIRVWLDGWGQALFGYVGADAKLTDIAVTKRQSENYSISASAPLARSNAGTITRCRYSGGMTAKDSLGGLVYTNSGTIEACCVYAGRLDGGSRIEMYYGGWAGGIAYENTGTIANSYFYGDMVQAQSGGTVRDIIGWGAIAYKNSGTVSNCYYGADRDDGYGGKTEDQFSGGEVAYLLNGGTARDDWRQNCYAGDNSDATPVLDRSHAQVRKTGSSYVSLYPHVHCICGGDATSGGHPQHSAVTYTAWTNDEAASQYGDSSYTAANSLPKDPGYYYLTTSVTLSDSDTWRPADGTVLCLNGRTVNEFAFYKPDFDAITVDSGVTFSLTECASIQGYIYCASSRAVHTVNNSGTFNMYNGRLRGTTSTADGAAVYNNGIFNMYGGTISNNGTSARGGGVYNASVCNLYGGLITNNGSGGGVYNNGTLTVGGTATVTGGSPNVYLAAGKTITLNSELDESARIGITAEKQSSLTDTAAAITVVEGGAASLVCFFPDDDGTYDLSFNDDDDVLLHLIRDHTHCACGHKGKYAKSIGDHTEHVDREFVAWTDELVKEQYGSGTTYKAADTLPKAAGYYYLTSDVDLGAYPWAPKDGTILCLNGHKITGSWSTAVRIDSDAHIVLTDCRASGSIRNTNTSGAALKSSGSSISRNGIADIFRISLSGTSVGVENYTSNTVNLYNSTVSGTRSAIYNTGTVNIAGTVKAASDAVDSGRYCVNNLGTLTVDGTLTADGGNIGVANRVEDSRSGTITVNGTLTSTGDNTGLSNLGTLTVNGALTATGKGTAALASGLFNSGGTLTVAGTLTAAGNTSGRRTYGLYNTGEGTVTVNGTFTASGGEYAVYNCGPLNLAGTVNANKNVYLGTGRTITVVGELDNATSITVQTSATPAAGSPVTIATTENADWIKAGSFVSWTPGKYAVSRTDEGKTVVLKEHEHEWGYTLGSDGTAISAECRNADGLCGNPSGGSVTIIAPAANLVYDGNPKVAKVENTVEGLTDPNITYKQGNKDLTKAPTDAGEYTASITLTGADGQTATASVEYTIAKATPTAEDFNITKPGNLTYDGTPKTATVTEKIGVTGMGDVTVKYFKNGAETEPKDAGDYTVKVSVAEGANYNATTDDLTTDDWKFTIGKATQTITVPTDRTIVKGDIAEDISVWATVAGVTGGSNPGTLSYVLNGQAPEGVSLTGNQLTVQPTCTAAQFTIKVTAEETGNYNKEEQTFTVKVADKNTATVTITGLPNTVTYGQEFTLTASQTGDTTSANKKWTWDYDRECFKLVGPNANTETITLQAIKAGTPSKGITVTYESGTHKGSKTVTPGVAQKEVTISGITAANKEYDGNTNATVNASGATITGKVDGDDLTVSVATGSTFGSADAGSRTVTLGTLTLDGTSAGNYTLATAGNQTEAAANITARDLTVKPNSGQSKSYGTTPDPVLAYTSTGTVTGETAVFDGALSREAGEDVGQYDITKGSLELKDSGTFKATNYNLVLDTVVVTFEITKGTYTGSTPTKTVNILKNYAGVQTGTLTAADFFTTAPAEAKITNAVPNANFSNMMSIAGADTSSGNFTYASKTNITAASDASWTVTISSKNYTDITTAELIFKLVDKTDVNAQITFPNGTLTYNGAGQKYEKATISGVSGGTWNYTYVANSGTGASLDSAGLPKTAGTYTVTAKYEDDAHIGTKPATLTVSKATPTGAPTCTKITTSGKTLADAPLAIGTIAPAGGTLAWDMDANTVVAANTAYGWTYTPADTANYKALTGSLMPYAVSSGGGGGGGSSAATPSVSDRIARELKNAKEGSTVTIDMKGETKLPASTTKEIAGKDVTVELDMGGGMVWSFNGLDVPKGGVRLDLGVKTGTKTIPAKVINALTGETTTIQLQLDHNGPFGMSLKLSVDLDKKHDGLYANLYFYNPKSGELEFQSASMISGGKASWAFDHASDCAIVIDKESHEPMTFIDVPDSAYYAEAVNWAVAKKITGGVGNGLFAPNDPCTRAQIVTFLWRAAGSPVVNYAMNMTDVAEDAYYGEAVRWALSEGITTGTGDGKFSPDATCNRAQSVTFLFRAIGKIVDSKAEFGDVLTDSYYANAVAWAVENGITNGIGDGLFGPDNSCTRAQIVTFLFRAYQGK